MWSKQNGHSRSWSSSSLLTVPKATPSITMMHKPLPLVFWLMGSFATWIFEVFSSFLHIFGSRKFKSFLDFRMRLKSEFATVSFSLTCTCLILQNFLFVGSVPYDDICCMCGVACPSHTFCLKAFSASFLELRSFRTLKSLKMPLLPANRNQSYIPR